MIKKTKSCVITLGLFNAHRTRQQKPSPFPVHFPTHARTRSCAALAAGSSHASGAGQWRHARRSRVSPGPFRRTSRSVAPGGPSCNPTLKTKQFHAYAVVRARPQYHVCRPRACVDICRMRTALQSAGWHSRGSPKTWPVSGFRARPPQNKSGCQCSCI